MYEAQMPPMQKASTKTRGTPVWPSMAGTEKGSYRLNTAESVSPRRWIPEIDRKIFKN
ncbi:hypothetical protein HPP92_008891 [Vanilla planifolia]|uniref:Uncharacterized protein n=1 Tax=Vanilla planifolia TaxID=51239 RepID=A0A835RCT1_VANPL|nr:hypothetical protein HPP92_008891 [Vanilla planifolia]